MPNSIPKNGSNRAPAPDTKILEAALEEAEFKTAEKAAAAALGADGSECKGVV